MNVKITVATPVYNREDCIGKCIKSVLDQSQLPFEMLLVDDGSIDATKEVIKKYKVDNPIISLFEAPKNGGENYARNRCVENAKGDFILWLDSDDYLVPNAIESVLIGIYNDPDYLHYMFVPSDREAEFRASHEFSQKKYVTTFEDWLGGKVSGDFVHVMHKSIFVGLPFFEEIIGFPRVNFLLIHKHTGRQLFINKVVTIRDRDRTDSLTYSYHLDDIKWINHSYTSSFLFFTYFSADLFRLSKNSFYKLFIKNFIMGIALGKIEKNESFIDFLEEKPLAVKILMLFNKKVFSKLFLKLIIVNAKRKLRKSGK
ncbi:MAG: glycosyltransferase family 2 protein [Candidatus Thorarchaeota archaeon]